MPPVSISDRPSTRRWPSMMTSLVWVEPTSTPPTSIGSPLRRHQGGRFTGSERLEVGVDPVLELGLRPDPRVDQVGFDKERRDVLDPGQVLAAVGHPRAHGPAALDGVIDDAVRFPITDRVGELVLAEEHVRHRAPAGNQQLLGEALQRPPDVQLEAQGEAAAGVGEVFRADEYSAPVLEQLQEAAEVGVAGRTDPVQAEALLGDGADTEPDL